VELYLHFRIRLREMVLKAQGRLYLLFFLHGAVSVSSALTSKFASYILITTSGGLTPRRIVLLEKQSLSWPKSTPPFMEAEGSLPRS
jgi:predicted transcriptional regulator